MVREAFLEVKNAHTRRGNKEVKITTEIEAQGSEYDGEWR
jgi:hypothetical protein